MATSIEPKLDPTDWAGMAPNAPSNLGWQPIETAPHGEKLLLCELDKWVPVEMHVGWWSGIGWVREGDDYDLAMAPTHWMPLPEPPTVTR